MKNRTTTIYLLAIIVVTALSSSILTSFFSSKEDEVSIASTTTSSSTTTVYIPKSTTTINRYKDCTPTKTTSFKDNVEKEYDIINDSLKNEGWNINSDLINAINGSLSKIILLTELLDVPFDKRTFIEVANGYLYAYQQLISYRNSRIPPEIISNFDNFHSGFYIEYNKFLTIYRDQCFVQNN